MPDAGRERQPLEVTGGAPVHRAAQRAERVPVAHRLVGRATLHPQLAPHRQPHLLVGERHGDRPAQLAPSVLAGLVELWGRADGCGRGDRPTGHGRVPALALVAGAESEAPAGQVLATSVGTVLQARIDGLPRPVRAVAPRAAQSLPVVAAHLAGGHVLVRVAGPGDERHLVPGRGRGRGRGRHGVGGPGRTRYTEAVDDDQGAQQAAEHSGARCGRPTSGDLGTLDKVEYACRRPARAGNDAVAIPGGDVAEETTPALRVLRGTPTAEELAALVGVLLRRSAGPAPAAATRRSRWRASALPGSSLRVGPGAWRASGLPG
ncbi:acyl-CoA carboxylase subunit epsilon [Planosporangium flavigriseum]|nr:acyl-CoA carboxylase subunit epsilon [Planosporangium flavigriseum]